MKALTFILGLLSVSVCAYSFLAAICYHNELAAKICLVSSIAIYIFTNLNHRYVWRDNMREMRKREDRRKYGNKDFTKEDEIIYKALKQTT